MSDLVKVSNTDLIKGGVGSDSEFMQVRPDRIVLVQNTSEEIIKRGGIPGKLFFESTGDQFDSLQLVQLTPPRKTRSYFEGKGFSKENLICFSSNNIVPDTRARIPQSMDCASCSKGSWAKYRETGQQSDLPKCKETIRNVVADRVSQLPYYLDVRGTNIPVWVGNRGLMQVLARKMALMRSQGLNPNIFDFSFTLYTVKSGVYYNLAFRDVGLIKDEDKAKFGALYLQLTNAQLENQLTQEEAAVAKADAEVTSEMAEYTI